MGIKASTEILLVDESQVSRSNAKQVLNRLGLRKIVEVSNGQKAYDHMAVSTPGLIICDFNVSGLNAMELITTIKLNPEYSKVPFVLLIEESTQEIIINASKAGVNGILVKPFSQQSLTEVLVKIFN